MSYLATCASTSTNVLTYNVNWCANGTAVTTVQVPQVSSSDWDQGWRDALDIIAGKVVIPKRALRIQMPDGAVIHVDTQGNYRIEDAKAQVIYQANRMREFNPYVNASDQLAKFIRFLGSQGVRRDQAGQIPISLFVNWLVLEAAEADGDPVPEGVEPLSHSRLLPVRHANRCRGCQRWLRADFIRQGLIYCRPRCAEFHYRRIAA